MQSVKPVYLLSNDVHLIEHWSKIDQKNWHINAIKQLDQIEQDNALVLADAELLQLKEEPCQTLFENQHLLVASCYPNDSEGQLMITLGARAYLHAYSSPLLIEQALAQVQHGQIWVGESLLNRLLSQLGKKMPEQLSWQQGLTAREITIAQRAALGHSNQLIANDLGISVRTVRAHLGSIFEKLDVNDRLMLALKVHGIS